MWRNLFGDPQEKPREEDSAEDVASDSSALTEGVGGVPDLDPEERATVSDVDGDNVETDRPNPQA
jgi:hypothetical protein